MKFAEIAPEIVTKVILTCSVSNTGLIMKKDGKVIFGKFFASFVCRADEW